MIKKNVRYVTCVDGEKHEFNSHFYSQFNSPSQNDCATTAATTTDTKSRPASSASKKQSNRNSSINNNNNTSSTKSNLNNKTNAQPKTQNNVRFSPNVASNDTPASSGSDHLGKNWIECWQAKCATITLNFDYYPSPVLDWSNTRLPSVVYFKSLNSPHFDCQIFKSDTLYLDIELGPSVIMLYGTFLKRLWYIKEAYLR